MLPLLVLRRLDAVLEPTKAAVLAKAQSLEASGITNPDPILRAHRRPVVLQHQPADADHAAAGRQERRGEPARLRQRVLPGRGGGARGVPVRRQDHPPGQGRDPLPGPRRLRRPRPAPRHASATRRWATIFEELLRKFSEMSNETAGEHYTPREVIRLMVSLLFAEDADALTGPAPIRTVYDPAAGTGGMLTVADAHLSELNPAIRVEVFGQELNPETWAIARSDLMIKGADPDRMVLGNSPDQRRVGRAAVRLHAGQSAVRGGLEGLRRPDQARSRAARAGTAGSAPGCPASATGRSCSCSTCSAKMKPVADDPKTPWVDGGSRIGIVLSGSPAVLRGGRVGGVGDPPLDHRERLAGRHRRPARPDVLQHRHQHLRVDPDQPQAPRPRRHRHPGRRPRPGHQDAQEPRRQAQGTHRRRDRRDHPPVHRRPRARREPGAGPAGEGAARTRTSASPGSPSNGPSAASGSITTRRSDGLPRAGRGDGGGRSTGRSAEGWTRTRS